MSGPPSPEPGSGGRVAIMQPTFAPWLGYFELLDRVDLFILLDDVQLSRQSFQTRNRILGTSPDVRWLPVPHDHRTPLAERLISNTPLTDPGATADRMANVLASFYRGSAWLDPVNELVRESFAGAVTLADVNVALISQVATHLGIATPTVLSSSLGVGDHRSQKVLGLLEAVGWQTYACAPGAVGYMVEEGVFAPFEDRVEVQAFEAVPYAQRAGAFTSHLSVLDALLEVGPSGTIEAIRAGRRPLRPFRDVVATLHGEEGPPAVHG